MRKIIVNIASLAWIAIISLSTVACGGNTNSKHNSGDKGEELSGNISLSGAFALYPLAVKWANDFEKLHPHVSIDISAGGAGKGLTDALSDVVDLGMVSRDLDASEIERGAVGFAVAKDAVVPTINAKNPVYKDLVVKGAKRQTFVDLWITGKTKTWGQVAGNSSKVAVSVYTRSDACGAAETWAKYLGKKQEDLKGTGVFGDPGVASAVQKDQNGIGLNNIGYAYDSKSGKLNPGIAILPIDVNENGKIDDDENFYADRSQLVKAIADGKYPSPPARDLYLVAHGIPKSPVVKAFLKYVLTQGQKSNESQGYITISQEKLQSSLKKLK